MATAQPPRPKWVRARSANSAEPSGIAKPYESTSEHVYLETTAQKAQRPAPSSQPDVAKPYGITRSVEPIIVFHTVKMIESEPAAPGRAEPSSSARCSPASTTAIGGSRSSASAGHSIRRESVR